VLELCGAQVSQYSAPAFLTGVPLTQVNAARPGVADPVHTIRRREITMFKAFLYAVAVNLALVAALVIAPAVSADKAPMPQTKGMQGMDPQLHDQAAKDPYEGCVPNPANAAGQARHPMPQTRGMQGMDPKAHTMDCPEGYVAKEQPAHVHKAPGG
jgi:hypothetical protein